MFLKTSLKKTTGSSYHIFDIPRNKDPILPKKLCVNNKIINDEQIRLLIMRALAPITFFLNISAKKACSCKIEDFIYFLLKLGV